MLVLSFFLSLQKEVYMIAAGVIGGVFLVCTLVMFVGVKERDGERILSCVCLVIILKRILETANFIK